jgi:hypothetical protein
MLQSEIDASVSQLQRSPNDSAVDEGLATWPRKMGDLDSRLKAAIVAAVIMERSGDVKSHI